MSVARIFDALSARPRGAPVLVTQDTTWCASALLAEIGTLSSRLGAGRTLAVLADNSPAWVMADLAALRAGVTHLPLPAFFSPQQLGHALNQASADTILTDQPERIGALDLGFATTDHWHGMAWMQRATATPCLPTGTAKVSFTSGSTGSPKGACLSADGLVAAATAVSRRLADLPIDRHLAALPLAVLLENVAGIYAPLLRGTEIHLPGLRFLGWHGMTGFDPSALQNAVCTARPNSMILVPELLKAWTLHLSATGKEAPPPLSYVAVGGARSDADTIRRARALGLPVYQGYGLTECGSVVSLNRPGDDSDDVGRPLDHVAVRIDNGEIVISAQSFLGYIGTPTAARGDISTPEFATGDLGHVDATGHLHLLGRRKNLLITSYGRNIAPEWVEARLLAQPAVSQAVVTGDGRPWLSAVVVPAQGARAEALAAALAQANAALPPYAHVRDWITAAPFTVQNGEATGNGRPIRAAIAARYAVPLEALYSQKDPADVVL